MGRLQNGLLKAIVAVGIAWATGCAAGSDVASTSGSGGSGGVSSTSCVFGVSKIGECTLAREGE